MIGEHEIREPGKRYTPEGECAFGYLQRNVGSNAGAASILMILDISGSSLPVEHDMAVTYDVQPLTHTEQGLDCWERACAGCAEALRKSGWFSVRAPQEA